MVKIGLIGAGFMGGMHSSCYEALKGKLDFEVVAVADLNKDRAEEIAKKFNAKIYSSGQELISNADINTVDICLPTYLHTEHAVMAMENGLDVLVEKPVCLSEDDAKKLLKVKMKTGSKVMVAQCIRFWSEYVYLKELVDSKTYGRIISGVFKRISPKPEWAWENWLHDSSKSGSATIDLHIHDVDFVRYLLGWPDSIKSEVTCINGSNEHVFALYKYNDSIISLEGGWDYPSNLPFEMEYRIKFENAIVIYNSSKNPSLVVYQQNDIELHPQMESDISVENSNSGGNISSLGGYVNEIKYFIECLNNGKEPVLASLEEGIESFRLVSKEIEAANI